MAYEKELQKALKITRQAGELALRLFDRGTMAEEKADQSPVTEADRECEKLLSRSLQESFPEDGIFGEEGTRVASRSGRRWIVDPIDGTKDFVRRNPFWAVQLALQVQDRIVLGIIYCPCMDEMLHATAGSGCYWNNVRVSASKVDRLAKSILMVSGFNAVWDSWPPDAVRTLARNCWTVRCYGGCYDVLMFARGKAEIWLSGRGMEWDYAPIQIIAAECGARLRTREGNDRIDARHCVLYVPGIEGEICAILGISLGI
jgi:histidinol-phosphatase